MTEEPKTQHFRMSEWDSSHPKAKPYPREWADRWFHLAGLLEKIRHHSGGAISITPNGGYRCEEHNEAVGGRPHSEHKLGMAADIKSANLGPRDLHALILKLFERGDLDELGGLGIYPSFVHVDTRPRPPGNHLAVWGGGRATKDV